MTKDYIITQSKLATEITNSDAAPKASAVKTYADAINTALSGQIANKADASALEAHTTAANNPHSVTAAQVGLGNVDNTSDADKPISTLTQAALDNKVDKVSGKGLSTEDYTTAEKTKLAGIDTGAEVNVIEIVKVDGTALTVTDKAVNVDLSGKVDKNGTDRLMTEAEGTKLAGIAAGAEVNVNANWTATEGDAQILNKPFTTIGAGLTVTEQGALTANTQFKFQIFEELPTASATYAQTIALILKTATETGNLYKEYACVNTTGTTWVWEQIGETQFELNIVQNASGISINDTALQAATDGQTGLLTAADYATFVGKQDALTFDDAPTASSVNPVKSGGIHTALAGKVNLAAGTVSIGHDSDGYYFNE